MKKNSIVRTLALVLVAIGMIVALVACGQDSNNIPIPAPLPEDADIFGNVLIIPEEGLYTYFGEEQGDLMIEGAVTSYDTYRTYEENILFVAINREVYWTNLERDSIHWNALPFNEWESVRYIDVNSQGYLTITVESNGMIFNSILDLAEYEFEEVWG